jgi:hypothetical protein
MSKARSSCELPQGEHPDCAEESRCDLSSVGESEAPSNRFEPKTGNVYDAEYRSFKGINGSERMDEWYDVCPPLGVNVLRGQSCTHKKGRLCGADDARRQNKGGHFTPLAAHTYARLSGCPWHTANVNRFTMREDWKR